MNPKGRQKIVETWRERIVGTLIASPGKEKPTNCERFENANSQSGVDFLVVARNGEKSIEYLGDLPELTPFHVVMKF